MQRGLAEKRRLVAGKQLLAVIRIRSICSLPGRLSGRANRYSFHGNEASAVATALLRFEENTLLGGDDTGRELFKGIRPRSALRTLQLEALTAFTGLPLIKGTTMLYAEEDLNELLICKEQELKELQARQIHFQETTLQETRKQLQEMHRKYNSLKEDFTYNLKILEERDRELERYDTLFIQLKMVENANQAEVSDLRIQVDKLQQALAQETKKQEALKDQYQRKLKEHHLALEQLHSSKDSDISHYHQEYENMKEQLERKLQEVEGELALQRQELLVEIDTEIKKREHEFRQKADEMSNLVLSHELKVKLLTKELEALKEAGMKAADSLKVAEAANLELEKQVRGKDWEIKDTTAIKDAQIQDLESKLASVQLGWEKEKETFERKHATIDHFAREKEAVIVSMKQAHVEQTHRWKNQIQKLQTNKETLEMKLDQAEYRFIDQLRQKEAIIEKLEHELEELKTNWDSQVARISKETVSKNLQIQAQQEEIVKLKAEVVALNQDIERYKQQFSLAIEKEESLERAKVQGELEWQRRCENAERNQYHKSEALIQNLSTARDQATAALKEKEEKLHGLEAVLSTITFERDQACQQLCLLKEKQGTVGVSEHFLPADIQTLQQQNKILRSVIAEMRKEMETLNNQAASFDDTKMKIQNADHKQSLEEEIRRLGGKSEAIDKRKENATEAPRKVLVSSLNVTRCNKATQTFHPDYFVSGNDGTLHHSKVAAVKFLEKNEIEHSRTGNPLVKWLQEDSVHPKQQLLSMGAGDGPHQHFRNHGKVIQARLKAAAKKICCLSKEKQQLLEMVNRLRTELGEASKEGFQDCNDSKNENDTFPGALYPKELVQEAKQHFLALDHLQCHVTKQIGLDSCTRNCTADPSVSKAPVIQQSQQLRRESPSLSQQSLLSSSAPSSLEEIWQMLEMGSSPSVLSPKNIDQEKCQIINEPKRLEESPRKAQEDPLAVEGTKFDVQSRLKPKKSPYIQSNKPQKSQRITKIRNYNIKD
ncbi:coiled-coil domain-containing protein 57 isoform X2 [Pantherophis guttatus]|uniref:Coiled-coil domain-containing protein 57 isoform X2 n=1 Tax=Pantherophis guttatus TaxID=94885 RepID=A0A6P9BC45_PANGU|nr:coiled-coil domain-containing protein 57 isoform X2 [Pantherophis guttatus]